MKSNKFIIANTVSVWAAVSWVTCIAFVWLLPGVSETLLSWWTHGRFPLGSTNLTLVGFVGGGVTLVIAGWIYGWLLGWAWEKVSGKK